MPAFREPAPSKNEAYALEVLATHANLRNFTNYINLVHLKYFVQYF